MEPPILTLNQLLEVSDMASDSNDSQFHLAFASQKCLSDDCRIALKALMQSILSWDYYL